MEMGGKLEPAAPHTAEHQAAHTRETPRENLAEETSPQFSSEKFGQGVLRTPRILGSVTHLARANPI